MRLTLATAFFAVCALAAPAYAQLGTSDVPSADATPAIIGVPGPETVDDSAAGTGEPVKLPPYVAKNGTTFEIDYPGDPMKLATYELVAWEQKDNSAGSPVCGLKLVEIDHDKTKTESQIAVAGLGLHPLKAFLDGELSSMEDNIFDCLPRDW